MRLYLVALLSSALLVGCASDFTRWAWDEPQSFRIPADSAAAVWGRAVDFVSRSSTVVASSDDVIQTDGACDFTVTRKRVGDSLEISVVNVSGGDAVLTGNCRGEFLLYVRDAIDRAAWERSR